MNRGIFYAGIAYLAWGLFPLYWKAIEHVPALEILAHRMVWSLVFVALLLAVRRDWGWLRQLRSNPRTLLMCLGSAILISINWFVYIWAVNAGHVVETSLGYFINPLVNVALGVAFLGERLRIGQGLAIMLALAGVLWLTVTFGALPWIALTLAGSFALYGLMRKTVALASLEGLAVETAILFIPALSYLLWLESRGVGALGHSDPLTTTLLAFAGVATAVPLLLFAAGARRITMTALGLLQYLAPTMQFLLGVFVYHEPVSGSRLAGFALIWLALALYTGESLLRSRRTTSLKVASGNT